MLITRTADTYEKIQALGGMASDDILSRPGQAGDVGGTGPFDKLRANVGDRGGRGCSLRSHDALDFNAVCPADGLC